MVLPLTREWIPFVSQHPLTPQSLTRASRGLMGAGAMAACCARERLLMPTVRGLGPRTVRVLCQQRELQFLEQDGAFGELRYAMRASKSFSPKPSSVRPPPQYWLWASVNRCPRRMRRWGYSPWVQPVTA